MNFKLGTPVRTWENEKIGEIDRVVVNPADDSVTHLVVRKGVFFTEDKLVPINVVDSADEKAVILQQDIGDPKAFPLFEETHFVDPSVPVSGNDNTSDTYPRSLLYYPPIGSTIWWGTPSWAGPYFGEESVETERNISDDKIALENAKVVGRDGGDVGNVKTVITSGTEDRITHLIIAKGLLFKEDKLIPITWVNSLDENTVRLDVHSDVVKELPVYKGVTA
jgi:uncharacterized protein YrrD